MGGYIINPIGYIRSEHKNAENTPIQPVFAKECSGRVELLPEYKNGLCDIEGFSHVFLLCWLHQSKEMKMSVKPYLDDREHGIFATRSPSRPNPIGISIVELIKKEDSVLFIQGIDMLDGTPVIDVKPYLRRFDSFPDASNGWQEAIDEKTAMNLGKRGYVNSQSKGIE